MIESNAHAEKDEEKTEESKAAKRARWEGFEIRVPCEGTVRVENVSYDDSAEHIHVANVTDGCVTGCTCESYQYQDGACKHMLAVEDRPAVLLAASEDSASDEPAIDIETDIVDIAADGGTPTRAPATTEADS